MKDSRNKQFIGFKLCAILINRMKSPAILVHLSHPEVNHLFPAYPECMHSVPISHLVGAEVLQCLCAGNPYIT